MSYAYIEEDLWPFVRPVGELVLDEQNARDHDDRNVAAIRQSLEQFKQQKPIVLALDGKTIKAGNGTYVAACQLGWTHIAARTTSLEDHAADAYAIADNRTGELAAWHEAHLAEQVTKLSAAGTLIGFTEEEIAAILKGCNLDRPGADAISGAFDKLSGGEPEYGQMSFVLSKDQQDCVNAAVDRAEQEYPSTEGNRRGYALTCICEKYLG
jgi:hypothetical protein